MTRWLLASLALSLCAAAAPALAAGPETPVSTDPTADQVAAWIAADQAAPQPLSTDPAPLSPLMSDRRIHGEVGVGVGNRGYGGYAAVQMPVGQASEVDLAVAGEHVNGRGPFRGGDSRSLMIGVNLDGRDLAHLISRDKCNVPRWGVSLKHDPVVLPDGRCEKRDDASAASDSSKGRGGRAMRDGSAPGPLLREPF